MWLQLLAHVKLLLETTSEPSQCPQGVSIETASRGTLSSSPSAHVGQVFATLLQVLGQGITKQPMSQPPCHHLRQRGFGLSHRGQVPQAAKLLRGPRLGKSPFSESPVLHCLLIFGSFLSQEKARQQGPGDSPLCSWLSSGFKGTQKTSEMPPPRHCPATAQSAA